MKTRILIALPLALTFLRASAQDSTATAEQALREGNQRYAKDDAQGAAEAYGKAVQAAPNDVRAQYNLGNAKYKQEQYAEAVDQYAKAAALATEPNERARANHNLGNAHLQAQKPKEAIEAFKKALRQNPNDEDTRYNLAYAQRMLKQQEQQQNKDEKKDDQEKKEEEKKEQEKKDEGKNEDEQKDGQKNEQPEPKEGEQQQPQPGQMSKQDAERMLDALNRQEKKTQDKVRQKMRAVVRVPIDKEW